LNYTLLSLHFFILKNAHIIFQSSENTFSMIFYSHIYDFIAKLVLVAIATALLFLIDPPYWIQGLLSVWVLKKSQAEFLVFLFFCIAVILPLFAWVYRPLLSPAAAWCYLRFSLKTPVTWATACEVESLFRPTLKRLEWYPMKDLKTLPPEERLPELLHFFHHLQTQES
jgi:hypothetical protein